VPVTIIFQAVCKIFASNTAGFTGIEKRPNLEGKEGKENENHQE
jgi:hypothetical protein